MGAQDKQDILRAISDLDERFTRALANMGYDVEGKAMQIEKVMSKSKSDIDFLAIMTDTDMEG